MADGRDREGVDGVGYGAFSGVGENGVACKGGDAEFDNGIVSDSIGGEGVVGGDEHAEGVGWGVVKDLLAE